MMALPMIPIVMSKRLLHQSCSWTVASLASARPKWRIPESAGHMEAVALPPANTLVGAAEEEAQYEYYMVAVQNHQSLQEG